MGIIQLIILFTLMVIGVYHLFRKGERLYFNYRKLTTREKIDIIVTDHDYLFRLGIEDSPKRDRDIKWPKTGYQLDKLS